jgi:hypothetical protein
MLYQIIFAICKFADFRTLEEKDRKIGLFIYFDKFYK